MGCWTHVAPARAITGREALVSRFLNCGPAGIRSRVDAPWGNERWELMAIPSTSRCHSGGIAPGAASRPAGANAVLGSDV